MEFSWTYTSNSQYRTREMKKKEDKKIAYLSLKRIRDQIQKLINPTFVPARDIHHEPHSTPPLTK